MKLIYRIALRLSLILIPLMALWATLFYFMMVEEINDEADDTLEDYSELIIIRMLAGRELPSLNSGSNNSYSITPIDEAYASSKPISNITMPKSTFQKKKRQNQHASSPPFS